MAAEPAATWDREVARAKVNLYLHVRGRTPEGYHLLESLAVFPRVGDLVEAEASDDFGLSVKGPFANSITSGVENLAMAAARAVSDRTPGAPKVTLRLSKTLPVAAGLGGGSADAGAVLRMLGRMWPDAPRDAFEEIAFALGADAPVCLTSKPAIMGGVGERLTQAPAMPSFWMVLINPGRALLTGDVFRALQSSDNPPGPPPPKAFLDFDHLIAWLLRQRNDLEPPARALRPVIAQALSALNWDGSCRLARMTGSGATCFGLFPNGEEALASAERLRRSEPGWWIAAAPVEKWEGGA